MLLQIEEFFLAEFEERFQVSPEDGSIKLVSQWLVQIYNECSVNDFESVKIVKEKAAASPAPKWGKITVGGRDAFDEEEDEELQEEEHCDDENCTGEEHKEEVDVKAKGEKVEQEEDDGWTTVKPKSRKR